MTKVCTVTTGARLHFGPLAWKPQAGRDFGGWGLMLDAPRLTLRLRCDDHSPAPPCFPAAVDDRAQSLLSQLTADAPAALSFQIEHLQPIPSHHGLGSGTQLALALGTAVTQLVTGTAESPLQLAARLGRGARSAVGIYGFQSGGLIVDAGKRPGDDIGQLAARVDVPANWRFVLLTPQHSAGLTGEGERTAFQNLPPFPTALTHRLSRLLLTEILPAVQAVDFETFAAALTEYGTRVGEAFGALQGGVVHAASLPLWNRLHDARIPGVAQTSWGPTLAVAQPSETAARQFLQQFQFDRDVASQQLSMTIAPPRNQGASHKVAPAPPAKTTM